MKRALLLAGFFVLASAQFGGDVMPPTSGSSGGGSPSGAAGGGLTGTYPNPTLAAGSVGSSQVTDGSIAAVDLATGACTTTQLLDGTILAGDFATGAVDTAAILNGTILAADFSTGAVDTTSILNGTILAADFSAGAVDTAAILNGTILAADFSTGAVDTAAILNGTILAADFSAGAVDTTAILNGTILAADFAVGAVDSSAILDDSIVAGDIATSGVTTTEILNGTILAADFASGAVDTTAILDGTIATVDLNSATVTSTQIVGPGSATDEAVCRFDGTTGKLAQNTANATISDAGLMTLVGVTTTGAVTISGVTDDITTVSNQDLTLHPNGSGSVQFESGDDAVEIKDSAGSVKFTVDTTTANSRVRLVAGGTSMALGFGAQLGIGTTSDSGSTTIIGCFADSISSATAGAGTQQFCVYGAGKVAVANRQSATCTAGAGVSALTLDPTSSVVYLTNSDADGCDVTISETSAVLGSTVRIIVISNAGGNITFADVANVFSAAGASCVLNSADDSLVMDYTDQADDHYVETSCHDVT